MLLSNQLDCFVVGGGASLLWHLVGGAMVLPLPPGVREGWGLGDKGAKAVAQHSLPPGRQLYPTWGRLIAVAMMAALSPPPAAVAGFPAVSGLGACGREGTAV